MKKGLATARLLGEAGPESLRSLSAMYTSFRRAYEGELLQQ